MTEDYPVLSGATRPTADNRGMGSLPSNLIIPIRCTVCNGHVRVAVTDLRTATEAAIWTCPYCSAAHPLPVRGRVEQAVKD
jgi:hypothetical protein